MLAVRRLTDGGARFGMGHTSDVIEAAEMFRLLTHIRGVHNGEDTDGGAEPDHASPAGAAGG